MRSAWAWWVAWLARREPATPLALVRLIVGAVVVWTLGDMVRTGVVVPIWVDLDHGGLRHLRADNWLIQSLGGATESVVTGLVAAAMVGGALTCVGLAHRAGALVSLLCCVALFRLHPGSGGGHDRLILNALWLLVLAPASATLSVSCRWRTGRWWSATPVAAWPRDLLLFQVAIMYAATGVQKLGADWLPWGGWSAVYYSLLLPSWARYELGAWPGHLYPLTQAATALTWVFEVTWPVLLLAGFYRATRDRGGHLRDWFNRFDLRVPYLVVGMGLHLGLWAVMNLGPFGVITLAYYPTLWHHDAYARLWRRLRGQRATSA